MAQTQILMLQPDTCCEYTTMQQNATATGSLPRTPLGIRASPDCPLVLRSGKKGKGMEGKGEWHEGNEGEGKGREV